MILLLNDFLHYILHIYIMIFYNYVAQLSILLYFSFSLRDYISTAPLISNNTEIKDNRRVTFLSQSSYST